MTIKPKRLAKGDTIGVVGLADSTIIGEYKKGKRRLEGMGYRIREGRNLFKKHGCFCGTDEERLSDLHEMFADKKVNAVMCSRGGYGSSRLLPFVDYGMIKKNPKILVGYSDCTALLNAIYKKCGLMCFHGPMLITDFGRDITRYSIDNFFAVLSTVAVQYGEQDRILLKNPKRKKLKILKHGVSEGVIVGGNLTVFQTLIGSEYCPDFRNKILFLEEVAEEPYKIDRMLTHLRNTVEMKHIRGLVFDFVNCVPSEKNRDTIPIEDSIMELFGSHDIPIVINLAFGHSPNKLTIPIGTKCRIDTHKEKIEIAGAVY